MPRRSVTEAARRREAENPPSKRILRSNTDTTPTTTVEELPPPPEFRDQYFYRNFGVHGVFVGICIRMARQGHRNGRDDAYFVRYDDGDIEDLCYSDLRRLCRRGPATKEDYLEASKKRAIALNEARRENERREKELRAKAAAEEAAKKPVKTETTPPATKTAGSASHKARSTHGKAASDGGNAGPDSDTAAAKVARKQAKRPQQQQPMKRKAKTSRPSSTDGDAAVCGPPPEKTLRTGLGWFNHTPCPVIRIEGARTRMTKEYLVRWGLAGQDSTWEPINNLHAQIVNDYEKQQDPLGNHVTQPSSATAVPQPASTPTVDASAVDAPATSAPQGDTQMDATNRDDTAMEEVVSDVPTNPEAPSHATDAVLAPHADRATAALTESSQRADLERELEAIRLRHAQLAESYQSVLAYLEPSGWAASSHNVKSLNADTLHNFPLKDFLKYVEHDRAEWRLEVEDMARLAESAKLAAEKKAETAEGKLEMFLARQTLH
eukprot:m.103930 g.103930  ORF g.103930 m.103930 type:complete len:494 (-) comp10502_c0_seq4:31-1512(-)